MRILVGMSGGVDSTYAAYKLMSEGHTVAGAVLKMHDYTEIPAAEAACASIGIPLYIIDCREAFERLVVSNFISEYSRARTPNPCVVCNSEVKFESLLDFAIKNDFDAIATGHYASLEAVDTRDGLKYFVRTARDAAKDQTYMLWRLSQRVLSHLILPLSDMTKEEVRVAARGRGLVAWDRGDSQEICFIPDNNHAAFIESRIGSFPEGNFVDADGNVLGRHKGIIHYTVGQRKGHGVALGARAFITDIDAESNCITLSTEAKSVDFFTVSGVVFSGIYPTEFPAEYRLEVKQRYRARPISANVTFLGDGRAEVRLDDSAASVAPGQSAVFYMDGALAAGGFID